MRSCVVVSTRIVTIRPAIYYMSGHNNDDDDDDIFVMAYVK